MFFQEVRSAELLLVKQGLLLKVFLQPLLEVLYFNLANSLHMVTEHVFFPNNSFKPINLSLEFGSKGLNLLFALLFKLIHFVIESFHKSVVSLWGDSELSLDLAVEKSRFVNLGESVPNLFGILLYVRQLFNNLLCAHLIKGYPDVSLILQRSK